MASCKYLDGLPTSGNKLGRAFRDVEWEDSACHWMTSTHPSATTHDKKKRHCPEEKIRTLSQEMAFAACAFGTSEHISAHRTMIGAWCLEGTWHWSPVWRQVSPQSSSACWDSEHLATIMLPYFGVLMMLMMLMLVDSKLAHWMPGTSCTMSEWFGFHATVLQLRF